MPRCPSCGKQRDASARPCKECGHVLAKAARPPRATKPLPARRLEEFEQTPDPLTASVSDRLSPARILKESAQDVNFLESADQAAYVAEDEGPSLWIHCTPFEAKRVTGVVEIGRKPDAEFPLVHIEVSRIHAR